MPEKNAHFFLAENSFRVFCFFYLVIALASELIPAFNSFGVVFYVKQNYFGCILESSAGCHTYLALLRTTVLRNYGCTWSICLSGFYASVDISSFPRKWILDPGWMASTAAHKACWLQCYQCNRPSLVSIVFRFKLHKWMRKFCTERMDMPTAALWISVNSEDGFLPCV